MKTLGVDIYDVSEILRISTCLSHYFLVVIRVCAIPMPRIGANFLISVEMY